MSGQAVARALRRPGRAPGAINLGIAVAVLAVLLPLLLHAASAAPPTAAEFSPNGQQVIKKAPPGSGGASNGTGGQGTGPGHGGAPSPTASPSPTPPPPPAPTLEVPRNQVKQCVGPPPLRQIEDPQSPPCIAYWKGDNGGATATGVTRDHVYIAIPTPEGKTAQYTALFNFFNKRFQFYGRTLVPEFCSSSGAGSGSADQANQVADAALAASGCGGPEPFASTMYRAGNNGAYYLPQMGCRYHVIAVGSYSPFDSTFMNACAPYLYQYSMLADNEFANVGEWICHRLAGRHADYAGSGQLKSRTRKFGVVLEPFADDDPISHRSALEPITDRLKACGAAVAEKDVLVDPVAPTSDNGPSAQNAILQLKSDGVTSVVCMCNFYSFGTLGRAAATSGYSPEWISSSFGLNDVDSSFILGYDLDSQLAHTFGITFHPRIVPPLQDPYNVALQEGDPKQQPDTTVLVEGELEVYRALLLLASGIQMAGPHLTVKTFESGLRKTTFPNPVTSAHAGAVGFHLDGHSMTDDAAEWWFDTRAVGPFSDSRAHRGTVCYLDGGRRYSLGHWPRGPAPFFTSGSCSY